MTVITIDERGCASLEIPDADGVVRYYLVAPAPAGLDDFAVTLERTDTGARYRVSRYRTRWACACPSWLYCAQPKTCKHVPEVARLEAFLRRLAPALEAHDARETA